MGRPRNPNTGMVVAREAVVVIVGAKAPVYDTIDVIHNRTGQVVTIPKDQPREEAVEGVSYTFKPYQRVPQNHPAVKECPGAFMEIDDLSASELEMVSS